MRSSPKDAIASLLAEEMASCRHDLFLLYIQAGSNEFLVHVHAEHGQVKAAGDGRDLGAGEGRV